MYLMIYIILLHCSTATYIPSKKKYHFISSLVAIYYMIFVDKLLEIKEKIYKGRKRFHTFFP